MSYKQEEPDTPPTLVGTVRVPFYDTVQEIEVYVSYYLGSTNRAVFALDKNGAPFGRLSLFLEDLPAEHFILKTYSENEGWALAAIEQLPCFEQTNFTYPLRFGDRCPVYRYRPEGEVTHTNMEGDSKG